MCKNIAYFRYKIGDFDMRFWYAFLKLTKCTKMRQNNAYFTFKINDFEMRFVHW